MKKIKSLLLIVCSALLVTTIASCAKEGCTDPDSVNYDPKAKKSDGTCRFEGRYVIWYDANTAAELILDDATSLLYYVDGKLVGSTSTSVYWDKAPDCGDVGSMTIKQDLGSRKFKSLIFSVKDQTGHQYWSGTLDFEANTCFTQKLVW